MRSYLYALHFAASITSLVFVGSLFWLFCAPFDKNLLGMHRLTALWSYHSMLLEQIWGCDFENREALAPGGTYIFVANHQSLADILVLYGLRRDFKWVAKDYLFKVPLLGWIMSLNRYVPLPKTVAGIREAMRTCRKLLLQGISVFIFPEGTRSANGEITEFYQGAFKLSTETGTAIVPVVIDGTHTILPKGSTKVCFGNRIRIKVLDPVYPADFDFNPRKLSDHVHAAMSSELKQMRATVAPHLVSISQAGENAGRKAS